MAEEKRCCIPLTIARHALQPFSLKGKRTIQLANLTRQMRCEVDAEGEKVNRQMIGNLSDRSPHLLCTSDSGGCHESGRLDES
jgi:hypothetical protein